MDEGLGPGELVSELYCHRIKDIATKEWWSLMNKQSKLCQLAVMDMKTSEEKVVEAFKNYPEKVITLVNEVLCLSLWRKEVLPALITDPCDKMSSRFPLIYIIMYHESSMVALLEIIMFHSEICIALGDAAVDLVDYCAAQITRLISRPQNDESKHEILLQKEEIEFGIGMRCITIILYLAENINSLSLSLTTRMFSTHDVPLLLCSLIDEQPWIREKNGEKLQFIDGSWHRKCNGSLAGRHEANAWLAVHQLLLHPELGKFYGVTEYAKGKFMRMEVKIDDYLVSQMPPLRELKQGLLYLSNFQLPEQKPPVMLELLPEMTNALLSEGMKGWSTISKIHKKSILEHSDMATIADSFSLPFQEAPRNLCTHCTQPAKSRCSKCKKAWYCSRNCQLQHFPYHKIECEPVGSVGAEK
ncbi:zinc finger MYND domain-containing protein 10 isoform X1 [Cloeon dipterum]|uniref:zinc finger MYND domain-containing protein 10 isoform X1 n=1 Tax=Cloeon dipterum TaxID=197152 RepID=UPI00321FF8DD